MFEIPRAGIALIAAVLVPGKAVERANELVRSAVFQPQFAPAVQADIVHRLDRTVILTRDQPRPAGIFEHDIIAGFGNILLARGKLPDMGPHFLAFGPREFFAGIALDRQGLRTAIFIGVGGQDIGRGPRIGRQQLCPMLALGAVAAMSILGSISAMHSLRISDYYMQTALRRACVTPLKS